MSTATWVAPQPGMGSQMFTLPQGHHPLCGATPVGAGVGAEGVLPGRGRGRAHRGSSVRRRRPRLRADGVRAHRRRGLGGRHGHLRGGGAHKWILLEEAIQRLQQEAAPAPALLVAQQLTPPTPLANVWPPPQVFIDLGEED